MGAARYQPVVRMEQTGDGEYTIEFKDVEYLRTDNPVYVGTLIFGLGPYDVQCEDNPWGFLYLARHTTFMLHRHVDGGERIPSPDLLPWIAGAVALAPSPTDAAEVERLIRENLGPNAFPH